MTASNGASDSAAGYSYNSSEIDSLPKPSTANTSGSNSIKQSSERVTGYSYNAEDDSNSSYVDNTQHDSEDKSAQPVTSEQSSDGYVDNSQHEDSLKNTINTSNVNKTDVETASGYSYEHSEDTSESVYIDNANYHQPTIDKKSTKHEDDLKKPSPMTTTSTPTPLPDLKNWIIDYFSLQNK